MDVAMELDYVAAEGTRRGAAWEVVLQARLSVLKSGVPLLTMCRNGFVHILAVLEGMAQRIRELARLREARPKARVDDTLGATYGEWPVTSDACGKDHSLTLDRRRRHNTIDKPERKHFGSTDLRSRAHELKRLRTTD